MIGQVRNQTIGQTKIKQLKSFPENLKFPYHFDEETFLFLALSIDLFIIPNAGISGSTTGITG